MYDTNTKTLVDHRELLKIKALALVAEVAIIRREEAKQLAFCNRRAIDPLLQREMYLHRTKHLRQISRLTHIARGFIKGLTLPKMENYPVNLLTGSDWDTIRAMVKKFGSHTSLGHYEAQRKEYERCIYAKKPVFVPKESRAPKAAWPFPPVVKEPQTVKA